MAQSSVVELSNAIRNACVLEATARKPGNVHPWAGFADLCYGDFVASADIASPILASAGRSGVGRCVLDAVHATQQEVEKNTNLGICLLLAPLAAVPLGVGLEEGIGTVLSNLTIADCEYVYRAIRVASAGGLGEATQQDVSETPTVDLLAAMKLAADRDRVAEQYANGFELVLRGEQMLRRWADRCGCEFDVATWVLDAREHSARSVPVIQSWESAIVGLHLELMAGWPDTLIARKCGRTVANESARRAIAVLDAGWPQFPAGDARLNDLDGWLRADGNRHNPGTTADLVAAILFAALRASVHSVGSVGKLFGQRHFS